MLTNDKRNLIKTYENQGCVLLFIFDVLENKICKKLSKKIENISREKHHNEIYMENSYDCLVNKIISSIRFTQFL